MIKTLRGKKMETKNNTCSICKKHIDKSDACNSWLTIIEKGYYNLTQEKEIKGNRETICQDCKFNITQLICELKIKELEKVIK